MRIKNTSRYPNSDILRLVKFASKGTSSERVEIHVKNSKWAFAGRAWHDVGNSSIIKVDDKIDDLIVVRIGSPDKFPMNFKYPGLKRAPKYTLNNWKEAIVSLTAHELYHIKQRRTRKRASEIKAETWAMKKLKEYREIV